MDFKNANELLALCEEKIFLSQRLCVSVRLSLAKQSLKL